MCIYLIGMPTNFTRPRAKSTSLVAFSAASQGLPLERMYVRELPFAFQIYDSLGAALRSAAEIPDAATVHPGLAPEGRQYSSRNPK
jgi:hypothetical protein